MKVKSKFINFLKNKQIVNLEFEFYKFLSKATVIHSHPEIQLTQISGMEKSIQLSKIYKLHLNIIQ